MSANNLSQQCFEGSCMARRVRRNVHECPADVKSHSVACLEFCRDLAHELKCRAQANTTKHTLNQQASLRFQVCVDSHFVSSAQCGVQVCFVCLAVTLCTAAHFVFPSTQSPAGKERNATLPIHACAVLAPKCHLPSKDQTSAA